MNEYHYQGKFKDINSAIFLHTLIILLKKNAEMSKLEVRKTTSKLFEMIQRDDFKSDRA